MSIGDRGDTLIALSTSGKSKNILKVLKLAKRMKIKTILLSSNSLKGKKISDIVLKAPTSKTDRAQEIHILVGHLICEELEKIYRSGYNFMWRLWLKIRQINKKNTKTINQDLQKTFY